MHRSSSLLQVLPLPKMFKKSEEHEPFLMHHIRSFSLWLNRAGMFPCLTGTYTPIAQLGIGGSIGQSLLMQVWTGAAAGILQSFFWSKAPKVLATSIYIGLGWIILPHAREVRICHLDPQHQQTCHGPCCRMQTTLQLIICSALNASV
jgi:channel protein (hemolysin III family)